LTPEEMIYTALEADVTKHIREAAYFWIATENDLREWNKARSITQREDALAGEKARAEEAVRRLDERIDRHYQQYYSMRRHLMRRDLTDEQLHRATDNLRKSKTRPEYKSMVRQLKDEQIDMGLYRPYFHAMDFVKWELERQGLLSGQPSVAFFRFMHRPHEFLDGTVPALHSLYSPFLRSQFFRDAIAGYGSEDAKNIEGKPIEAVCDYYGAILAVVMSYAERVAWLRSADYAQTEKAKHRREIRQVDTDGQVKSMPVSVPERSFEEDRGTAERGSSGQRGYLGIEDHEERKAERNLRKDMDPSDPMVSEDDIQVLFDETNDARDVLVYLRRSGKGGHQKTSVSDLVREYGRNRRTIWRWCTRGKKLCLEKGAELLRGGGREPGA